jgi:hypothetical protein
MHTSPAFEFPASGSPTKAALSPKDTNAEAAIKAWGSSKGAGSRIPAPPAAQCFATPEHTIKSRVRTALLSAAREVAGGIVGRNGANKPMWAAERV